MKNITLSADEALIDAARARAREEQSTLNEQFRQWLALYARHPDRERNYLAVVTELRGKLTVDKALTREQRNER